MIIIEEIVQDIIEDVGDMVIEFSFEGGSENPFDGLIGDDSIIPDDFILTDDMIMGD